MKISLKFSGKVMNSKNFNWSILHSLGGPYAAWNKNPTKSKSLRYLCGESGRLKSLGSQDAFSCKSRICRSAMKSACEAHISIPPKTTTFCFGEQKYMLLPFVFHFTYKSQTFVPTIFQHSIEKWSFLALQEWLFCALKAPRGGGGKVKIEYTFDCQWVYSKLRAVERKGKRRKSNHEVENCM